jgi:signal transduction histidine kinase
MPRVAMGDAALPAREVQPTLPGHAGVGRAGARAARSRLLLALTSPIAQFAVTGLVATAVVGVLGAGVARHQALQESVHDARDITQVTARLLQADITPSLRRGDAGAIARLDRIVRNNVILDPLVRLKLWSPDGRIVYSDEHRLIGERYRLRADDAATLRTGSVDAELSDLTRPENRFERSPGRRLLEVYLPVKDTAGKALLFETYIRYSSVLAGGREIWLAFAPSLLISLAVLWLVQLPLALSLARRFRSAAEERESLLLRAINAGDSERRRIAAGVHDGIVQELTGVSYRLEAAGRRAASAPREELGVALSEAAGVMRENMRRLRALLIEIYPRDVRGDIASALQALASPLVARGISIDVTLDPGQPLAPAAEDLVFRTAQEALRNAVAHSGCRSVELRLGSRDGCVELSVRDDGIGFDTGILVRRRGEGHFGLTLLVDRSASLGGKLDVISSPGNGTTVRLELPLR